MTSKINDFFSFLIYACKADYTLVSNAFKKFWDNGNVEPVPFFTAVGCSILFLAVFLIFPRTTTFILFIIWRFYSRAVNFENSNTKDRKDNKNASV